MRRLSLRFTNSGSEEGFVRSCSPRLLKNTAIFAFVAMVSAIFSAVFDVHVNVPPKSDDQDRVNNFHTGVGFTIAGWAFTMGIVCMALLRHPRIVKKVGYRVVERVLGVQAALAVIAVVIFSREYNPRFFGLDPVTDVFTDRVHTDTRLLLIMNFVVSSSHVALPIRWCVLVWTEVVCVASYATCVFYFGSPEGSLAPGNFAGLICLVYVTSSGKRASEKSERLAYQSIINERCLRVQAEHRESSMEPPLAEHHRNSDKASSYKETLDSASIFSDVANTPEGPGDTEHSQLERVMRLGQKEHWIIDTGHLRLHGTTILGEGGFGTVVPGEFQGSLVAVKITREGSSMSAIANELRILRHVRHPNVVSLFGACIDKHIGAIAIVMDFVEGGRLDEYLRKNTGATQAYQLVHGVAAALRYLHALAPPVVHGDLKPANILVEERPSMPVAKVLDFGLSRIIARRVKALGGTLSWMAPEVALRDPNIPPSAWADIYSFGLVVHYIITQQKPWAGMSKDTILEQMKTPMKLVWPSNLAFPVPCRAIIDECVLFEPARRPAMGLVYQTLSTQLVHMRQVPRLHLHDLYLSWQNYFESARERQRQSDWPSITFDMHDADLRVRWVSDTWNQYMKANVQQGDRLVDLVSPAIMRPVLSFLLERRTRSDSGSSGEDDVCATYRLEGGCNAGAFTAQLRLELVMEESAPSDEEPPSAAEQQIVMLTLQNLRFIGPPQNELVIDV